MNTLIKTLALSALTCLAFHGAAQEESSTNSWSIGLYYSADYSSHQLYYSEELSPLIVDWRQNAKPGFGFNTGVSAHYEITPHFELVSGIGWTRFSDRIFDIPIVEEFNEFVGEEDVEYQYNYVSVPLRLNFYVLTNKLSCYFTGGASANVYLSSQTKSTLRYDDGTTRIEKNDLELEEVNEIAYTLLGGVGVRYDLSERFNLRFEPMFRYSLTKLTETIVSQNNYSIGGQFGVVINL